MRKTVTHTNISIQLFSIGRFKTLKDNVQNTGTEYYFILSSELNTPHYLRR